MRQLIISLLFLVGETHNSYAILCESTMMVKSICVMSSVPILNVLPTVRSKLQCAVACSQHDACKSSVFDIDGVCRTYTDYAMYGECASEKFYIPVFEVNIRKHLKI